jgi:hypothetical protein
MALVDNAWYVNSVTYGTVTAWAAATVYAAGDIRRQSATPAVNSERCFVCIVAGTSHATTEPTWVITRGGKTTDNTVTWQECTGVAATNGDATNTPSWTISATPPGGVKNTAVVLGQVIKRDNGASYQICSTAGTAGNGAEPAFSDTAGVTTADNTVTWTSLGVVGNFTGWQYPAARLRIASNTNWGFAGNNFYLASEHAETQAATMNMALTGTLTAPCKYLCVTKTTVPPTSANVTTGASLSTTGAFTITIAGAGATGDSAYVYGLTFNAGSGAVNNPVQVSAGGANAYNFNSCAFNKLGTAPYGVGAISLSGNFVDCSFGFGNVGDNITILNHISLLGNTTLTGTIPTGGLFYGTAQYFNKTISGADLSNVVALFATTQSSITTTNFINCKLNASATVATPSVRYSEVSLINCDSGATNYRHEKYTYEGTQTVETTIVRTGGATNGTTPISWKIVTTANSKLAFPFESLPIAIWNDTTATTRTITLYGIWGGGAVPTNADIWFELNYMGSSATPISTFATCGVADVLASGTNLTTDTSTWGGSTTKFLMSVTLSSPQPNMKGPIYLTVKAAKISSTFYIDPKPVIT